MTYPVSTIVRALEKHQQFFQRLDREDRFKEKTYYQAHEILFGIIDLQARLVTATYLREWIDRRKHRANLLNAAECSWSKEGRKAIDELIRYAISQLEADEPFRPEVDAGLLPMPASPRKLSDEHKAALVAGRQKKREEAVARHNRRRDWETRRDLAQ